MIQLSDTNMAALLDAREKCKDGRYQHWMNFYQGYKEEKYTKRDFEELASLGFLDVEQSCMGGDCYLINKRGVEALP